MTAFPPPATLTAHQPPALLVAELLDVQGSEDGGRARLATVSGLDALQVLEGCAQSLAVILGHGLRAQGGPPASGMLVGAKDAVLVRPVPPGAVAVVEATLEHRLPPFRLYRVRVVDAAGDLYFSAELKTVSTSPGDHP